MKRARKSNEAGKPGMSRRAFMGSVGAVGVGAVGVNVARAAASFGGASASREAPGQGAAAIPPPAGDASRTSLDGKWKLFYFAQGKYPIADPEQLKTSGLVPIEALVPGEAALDLSRHGELPADLYFGENILKLRPYELYEWWYQREFATPGSAAGERLELFFHGVDCLATYWLNGKKLGETANALIEHQFDVTGRLNRNEPNVLTVRLRSPVLEAAGKQYDPGWNAAQPTNMEQIWIRKAPHSFGWNIMPRAVSAGLWRPVELIVHAPHEVKDLYFTTLSVDPGHATVAVRTNSRPTSRCFPISACGSKAARGNSTFTHVENLEFTAGRIDIDVPDPILWWPRGYGQPNLYQVTTELLQDETVLASRHDTVGIRKLELIWTQTTSSEEPGQFLFKVNGVPILCQGVELGAGWTCFTAAMQPGSSRFMALMARPRVQLVRCWGRKRITKITRSSTFVTARGSWCGRTLLWPTRFIPRLRSSCEVIKEEAISVVKKLRNHPSLAMWCGDNEYDQLCYVLTWILPMTGSRGKFCRKRFSSATLIGLITPAALISRPK